MFTPHNFPYNDAAQVQEFSTHRIPNTVPTDVLMLWESIWSN